MKTDKYLAAVPLTRNQSYFVSIWFNMVHAQSLDSYRVRALAPCNALRELQKIYELGKADERAAVRAEARAILDRDLTLREEPFTGVTARLLQLLADSGELAKAKEDGPHKTFLMYFQSELGRLIDAAYVPLTLQLLERLLLPPNTPMPPDPRQEPDRFEDISTLTGHLLSTLIDRGASLESLYKLYAEILVPRHTKRPYRFGRRFALTSALLTRPATSYHVVFALDNVTSPQSFPPLIGGIRFSVTAPLQPDVGDTTPAAVSSRKYLTPANKRLFASKVVTAQDPRAAGAEAADAVNDMLNLVRFEYERARVSMPDSFAFVEADKALPSPRVFSLPTVVPNPTAMMDGDGLTAFVASVDELVHNGNLLPEGRDRVRSAFRLYRTGLDTNVLENKLVNWWTALEYLTRGGTDQAGSIGKSVEVMLTPVLSNAYIAKHITALRSLLLDLGATLTDPESGQRVTLKGMSTLSLYELFKRTDMQPLVLEALKGQVFASHQAAALMQRLTDPKQMHASNAAHEQRLRWHLQRLWRARCDIVHSAERTVNAALLCANLEYYLKTTLMALLKSLREIPTLSGPREFFDRQGWAYNALQADLREGRDAVLKLSLDA